MLREGGAEEGKLAVHAERLRGRPHQQFGVAFGVHDDDRARSANDLRKDDFQEPRLAAPRGTANKHVTHQFAPRQYQGPFLGHPDGVQGRVAAPHVPCSGQRGTSLQVRLQFLSMLR